MSDTCFRHFWVGEEEGLVGQKRSVSGEGVEGPDGTRLNVPRFWVYGGWRGKTKLQTRLCQGCMPTEQGMVRYAQTHARTGITRR